MDDRSKINIERLIKDIRKEDVALFIGSGFSFKAGAPSATAIIDAIVAGASSAFLDNIPEQERTLRNISEAYIKECNGRNELMCILRDLFSFVPIDTSNQEKLYLIPHFKVIFTTNYDSLIENSYKDSERVVITADKGVPYTAEDRTNIYKIHGDITTLNDPDSIIISESDYKGFFTNNKFRMICQELMTAFVKKHILFIGYSLQDDDILEMIEEVRECVGDNMKGMYLVAPNMNEAETRKLEENKISYINSCADELLDKILIELKSTIKKDYNKKKVSQETFETFCFRNGNFNTTTQHLEKENRVVRVDVKEGEQRKDEIKFSVPYEILETPPNDAIRVDANTVVPAYKILSTEMLSFKHSLNGITLSDKEDISSMTLAPLPKTVNVPLRMDSIHFNETIKARQYIIWGVAHIDFNTPVCAMKVTIAEDKEIKGNVKFEISIELVENYKTIDDALKWAQFFLNIYQGKEYYLLGIKFSEQKPNKEFLLQLQRMKEYYERIEQIEKHLGTPFDIYDKYSKVNAEKIMYLYSYLLHKNMVVNFDGNAIFTLEIDTREEKNRPLEKFNTGFSSLQRDPIGNIKFNGKDFNIPYRMMLFRNCIAKEIKQIDDNRYSIKAQDQSHQCVIWCANEPTGLM